MTRIVNGQVVNDEETGQSGGGGSGSSSGAGGSASSSLLAQRVSVCGRPVPVVAIGGAAAGGMFLIYGVQGLLIALFAAFVFAVFRGSSSRAASSRRAGRGAQGPRMKSLSDLPPPPARSGG